MVALTIFMGSEDVAAVEIGGLIAASKVNGTNVYNGQGDSPRFNLRCDDRQELWRSCLCGDVVWQFFGSRGGV